MVSTSDPEVEVALEPEAAPEPKVEVEPAEAEATADVAEPTSEPDENVAAPPPPEPPVELTAAPVERPPRRRAKVALLVGLFGLAAILVAFSAWYIVYRKPVTALPIPGLAIEPMPGYGYSFYGPVRPTGIAVTADGSRIYATQSEGEAAVFVYDNRGELLATMAPPDTATDHVFVYVAVHPLTGEVYVSDRPIGAIHVYSADGDYLREFEPPASLAGWQPLGLGFDPAGHLFVTNAGIGAIHEFDAAGVLLRTIGGAGEFSFPNAAVQDSAGRIYIADSNNGRVVVLGADGAQLSVIGRGPGEGDVGLPRGMAVDDEDRVYVVDSVDHSVKVYRPADDGSLTFVGRFGDPGIGDGNFQFPNAVATDARGRVYVADWNNNRVQVWSY